MFTLVGWSEAQSYGAALAAIAALPDPHVRVEGSNIIVPPDLGFLGAVMGIGAYISQVRMESPSLRRVALLDLVGLNIDAEPVSPNVVHNQFHAPIMLDAYEPMRALVSNTASSGTTRVTVLAWLTDGSLAPSRGEIYTIRAAASATLTAYAWTNAALSFSQVLPAGRYQVVGMAAQSAGLLAARLVFVGGKWRPGCVGQDAAGDITPEIFRHGRLGVWGEFTHDAPPTVDFLSSSADTSEIVWLDIVKVG
jgi:hypothetical protein